MSKDLDVDDIFDDSNKKKKLNGCRKGKSGERLLVALFNERFGEGFSRSIGSGNRWGQKVSLPQHAVEVFTGDLCCPKGFKWVLESKNGYDEIDLNLCMMKDSAVLNSFIDQVMKDSHRSQRKPMLLWKKTRRPWIAFVHNEELKDYEFKYKFVYGKWTGVALEKLLELEDSFFLNADVLPNVVADSGKID